jgi:Mut7-C RNAse domain
MLGRLTRWLRVLGFDTQYDPALHDAALVRLARAETASSSRETDICSASGIRRTRWRSRGNASGPDFTTRRGAGKTGSISASPQRRAGLRPQAVLEYLRNARPRRRDESIPLKSS